MIQTIIFLTVLFVLSIILAFIAGRYSVREEIKDAAEKSAQAPSNFYQTVQSPEFTKEDLDTLSERIYQVDQQVQAFNEKQASAPVNLSMGAERRLEMIEPLAERVKALEDREQTYQERFRRVEKKAGMNV